MFGLKRTKAITEVATPERDPATITVTEAADFLVKHTELGEAYTRADIELALDDRGWLMPANQTFAELDAQTRKTLLGKARLYWFRDPLAKQAVRLWTDYALSNGVTFNADDPAVQTKLDKFWKDRRNRRLLSSEGQRRSSKKLLIDGEVFFAIFNSPDGGKVIRWLDPMQITDVICDPEDSEHILAYRRLLPNNKVLFYRDWAISDEDAALAEQQKVMNQSVSLELDVVVYHLPFDCLHQRGNGLLSSVVDWSREHRRFMEARVAITQALAKYAYKTTVKGGQAVIDSVKSRLQSSYAAGGVDTVERNPQNAPGGNWLQNAGIDVNPMPRATGGSDAEIDGNALKLMVSAGTGIMLHYFGDPSTGNLATATAMELPMLKMFESYQQLWIDAYRDIFTIVLDEDPDDDAEVIDIDLPPILADDLQALSTSITAITTVFPEAKVDEVLQMMLVSLGVNNVEEVMKKITEKREADAKVTADNKKRMDKLLASNPADPKKQNAEDDPDQVGGQQMSNESARELAKAMTTLAEALHL